MLKIAWTEEYCHNLPENHRFPMIKYELIPQQLLHEGIISPRDRLVLAKCHARSVPVVAVMGGGYSPQIRDIVEAHTNTFRLATDMFF
jgi:acetoin utilization deacetylase AcuC-like enzyme